MGATSGGARETAQGQHVPDRGLLRVCSGAWPSGARHELCLDAKSTADGARPRRRRVPAPAPMGGHRQQHTEHRSREREHAGRGRRPGQT